MQILQTHENKNWRNNYFLKAFAIGLGLSFLVFIPFIVVDGGRFLFYGDFNVQQIPFYRIAHDAVREGNIGWNHLTDLGANFIGSYSFYLLGSPFFWLTIPFPSESLQFLMGPLLILKFACATLAAYTFLRRYVKNQNYALLGAILYAFSGYSIYNIFFNHFHEAIIVFPLLLAALDSYMYQRKRGVFAVTVALSCIMNYYFFVGQVTFTLIYFCLRLLCKSWKISVRDFLWLALEAVMGFGISMAILLPSVYAVTQNSRTSNMINGWNAVIYNKNQRYLHIIESLFFPPDLPARPNFTPESESKWASLGAWLPLFSMTGVIGWLQLRKKHWLKKMLWVLFAMSLIPILNASFQLFNSSYYGRWLYMLTLMMSLATILSLEYAQVNWKRSTKWTVIITSVIAGVIGFMPTITTTDDGKKNYSFGLEQYPSRFWTYVGIAMICLAVLIFLFRYYRRSQKLFIKKAMFALSIISILYSVYFISIGKTQSDATNNHIIPYALNGGKDVNIPDLRDGRSRSDFYESMDNSAMFWKVPSIQAFHSIVPGSVMDFYKTIGVQRDVASRPETSHYALRALTSVKWLFDDDHDSEYFAGEEIDTPAMPGWIYSTNANGFDIWENEYYIPMGFSYDYYVTPDELEKTTEAERELLMLKAVVIEDQQAERLSNVLTKLPDEKKVFTKNAYYEDAQERAAVSCSSFNYTRRGFNAEISSGSQRFIFFSVPFEDGWSASVNGEPATLEKVNVGFMGVSIPQGEKVVIEFTYRTPGLLLGILVSLATLAIFIAYLLLFKMRTPVPVISSDADPLLARGSFQNFASQRQATFIRPGAMVPKEYRSEEIPNYAEDSNN